MELVDPLAACLLVQSVDVLSHHRLQLAQLFQLGQRQMGGIGLYVQTQHFVPIEPIKFLGVGHEIVVAENGLRRQVVVLMI